MPIVAGDDKTCSCLYRGRHGLCTCQSTFNDSLATSLKVVENQKLRHEAGSLEQKQWQDMLKLLREEQEAERAAHQAAHQATGPWHNQTHDAEDLPLSTSSSLEINHTNREHEMNNEYNNLSPFDLEWQAGLVHQQTRRRDILVTLTAGIESGHVPIHLCDELSACEKQIALLLQEKNMLDTWSSFRRAVIKRHASAQGQMDSSPEDHRLLGHSIPGTAIMPTGEHVLPSIENHLASLEASPRIGRKRDSSVPPGRAFRPSIKRTRTDVEALDARNISNEHYESDEYQYAFQAHLNHQDNYL
ncbi:hypothetical protein BU24DRAFT_160165 [Aaosphaeria arxii CBS 175.79]|uniref:Uncharacterized protein n=1 Tax=Aaosphaeria arxii CBS 175.79 TaxID=1450172 RepID=A0A6A5XYC2_9PLEO|nr:uncharacterized protein BU24DRAFT_160165 [Aaosphaeria arxii CBS 175.79]KAF2017827.1 hypothetical protein BU24DRAFT_160165 [Aaosphaeria arxii CBS 175.79]